MQLPMTVGNYGRPRVGLPTTRLVNAYIEKTSEGPAAAARIPRPGLNPQYVIGAGPILRQFQEPGVFGSAAGDLFSISGTEVYKNQTKIGDISATGPATGRPARMAATTDWLAITYAGNLYVYDGTTFTHVTTFDDGITPLPAFSSVAVLYDLFIFPQNARSVFYWSAVDDPSSINALNFSSAQTDPSPIQEVAVLAEELVFFKFTATEFWDYQGQLTAPFALSQGRTYSRGCSAANSVVQLDNTLFFVGDDLSAYRCSQVPLRVSTPLIDDRLNANGSQTILAFQLYVEGHTFYILNLPMIGESYAYDCQTQEWAQWGTQNGGVEPGVFAASVSTGRSFQNLFAGSSVNGQVYLMDPAYNFDGAAEKRVVVSAAHWISGGVQRCNNVSLACVRGVGDSDAPNPTVSMRYSNDAGRTFTDWMPALLGAAGQYNYKATWRNLGIIQQPGRLFEFAVSDPVYFVAEGASMNEARV